MTNFHNVTTARDVPEMKHHEQILPRIVGSKAALQAARNYVYRLPFTDKMEITRILNVWNKSLTDDREMTGEVIRSKSASVISSWSENAKSYEAAAAEKFLSHLKAEGERLKSRSIVINEDVENKHNEKGTQPLRGILKSAPCRNYTPRTNEAHGYTSRPHTSITHGSYYPCDGYGNDTSVFSVVGGTPVRKSRRSPLRDSKTLWMRDIEPGYTGLEGSKENNKKLMYSANMHDTARYNASDPLLEARRAKQGHDWRLFYCGSGHMLHNGRKHNPGRIYERTQFMLG